MLSLCSNDLKLYSSVKELPVDWLWYPYIPYGKITLLQGDPGGGKSTLMLSIIAALSNGGILPDGTRVKKPLHVIYQCSEDGAADTIKPRLLAAGADCQNVAFFDEEAITLTLNDEVIRRAIADFNAKLLVVDPFQAYLGDSDISSATSVRKMLRQLGMWATAYDCAIVLIGHLNKKQGSKDIYRGLGSIDMAAAARSVLQVEMSEDGTEKRTVRHIKSSLAPHGRDLNFIIDHRSVLRWMEPGEEPEDNGLLTTSEEFIEKFTRQEQAGEALKAILANGPVRATEIKTFMKEQAISERTLMMIKKIMGIYSFRKNGVWFWSLKSNTETTQGSEEHAE